MALRTTSNPLAPLTHAQWRTTVCAWIGVAYSQQHGDAQAELDRIVNETHDYISKRLGHDPYAKRRWTPSAPSLSDGTFTLASDVRIVRTITESDGSTTRDGAVVTEEDYRAAWGAGHATHPWQSGTVPYYFFEGMTADNPPVQQWKRVPTPTAALTVTVTGYPYFGKGENDTYTELPATLTAESRHHARSRFAAFQRDYATAREEAALRDDCIAASAAKDAPHGLAEVPRMTSPPATFWSELG